MDNMEVATATLAELREGNARFVAGAPRLNSTLTIDQRQVLAQGQQPKAVVLGCSDARVPVEMIFDQGFGELFVIRVAGNVVASSQIDSVEFAVDRFNVPLVIVLGHTQCGAILATMEELRSPSGPTPNLRSIVDRVRPAIQGLLSAGFADEDALVTEAVRSNVRASANSLRHGSARLEQLVGAGELLIVGAEYSLEDGIVDFFDGLPMP